MENPVRVYCACPSQKDFKDLNNNNNNDNNVGESGCT
jgi:hypothetical protein